jgi:hypothetical protein
MFLIKPVIIGIGLCSLVAYYGTPAQARAAQEQKTVEEQAQTRWEEQAEKNIGLGKGLGRQLMTEEEWREHHRKMQSMSATEREQYRKEVHQLMMERAKERGIAVPETPGPRGPMKGPGPGKGGGRGGY